MLIFVVYTALLVNTRESTLLLAKSEFKTEYELKEFFVLREPLDNIIPRLENPKVFAFSQYYGNSEI